MTNRTVHETHCDPEGGRVLVLKGSGDGEVWEGECLLDKLHRDLEHCTDRGGSDDGGVGSEIDALEGREKEVAVVV